MTGVVKSRREDTVLKRKLLRQNLKIGSWNVRTLRQTGKLNELCDKASRYRLDIVGVQEVRWGGQGKLRISGGMSFIYSGRVTEDHGYRVLAFCFLQQLQERLRVMSVFQIVCLPQESTVESSE